MTICSKGLRTDDMETKIERLFQEWKEKNKLKIEGIDGIIKNLIVTHTLNLERTILKYFNF